MLRSDIEPEQRGVVIEFYSANVEDVSITSHPTFDASINPVCDAGQHLLAIREEAAPQFDTSKDTRRELESAIPHLSMWLAMAITRVIDAPMTRGD